MKTTLWIGLLFILIFFATLAAQTKYTVKDIGTLGGVFSWAHSINDSGEVAGETATSTNPTKEIAFLYRNGAMTNLETLSMDDRSRAFGINNLSKVVGSSYTYDFDQKAFLYQNGAMISLEILECWDESCFSYASGINDFDNIVGTSTSSDGRKAFLYQNNVMTSLGTLGGPESFAYAINNLNEIVGAAEDPSELPKPFLYKNGMMTELIMPAGFNSGAATGINDNGIIIGNLGGSFLKGFVYQNGVMSELGTLGGSWCEAKGINNSGEIVGWSKNSLGSDRAFLYKNGIITDLNSLIDSSSGWLLSRADDINNRGEIVGYGSHNGFGHGFILIPNSLSVSKPLAGELWIAGEKDTIKWSAAGIDKINLKLSTDYKNGVGQFDIIIVEDYPADSGYYVWDIPDSILSRKCGIIIESSSDPNNFKISEVFKIKGYRLTRVTNGNYELYLMGEDSWIKPNQLNFVWPPTWYQQFDYMNGNDPFTGSHYSPDFQHWTVNAKPEDHIDWPSFVRAFNVDKCYLTTNFGGLINPLALWKWAFFKGEWGGSCFGFVTSSFLAFDHKEEFKTRFGVPEFNDINTTPNDVFLRIINELFGYQMGSGHKNGYYNRFEKRPDETLEEVKQMLLSEDGDNRGIAFRILHKPAGHIMNPWKVLKDPVNADLEYIYVYDSNFPFDTTMAITVNINENSWKYGFEGNKNYFFTQTNGLFLGFPSGFFLQDATLPFTHNSNPDLQLTSPAGDELIEVYNPPSTVLIKTADADSLSYDCTDSILVNTIPDALPNILLTGHPGPPIGYFLPKNNYYCQLSEFQNSLSYFSVIDNSTVLTYARFKAEPEETDKLSYYSGIGITNPDEVVKPSFFQAIIVEDSLQKVIEMSNLDILQTDSVHFSTDGNIGRILNGGSIKSYDLLLKYALGNSITYFEHRDISLSANSTHLVVSNWTDFSKPLVIQVDNGNDGTIDDTITVTNTVDVDDEGSLLNPTEYYLAQNYPNPFNPTTNIEFRIANFEFVSLKVYDALGREIANLINEEKQPGTYSVEFDGSSLSSGIYFYQIVAGSYNEVKKMILIK